MGILTTDLIEQFVYTLYRQENEFLKDLRQSAEEGLIPIITRDTERFLYTLCRILRPDRILEIGTAVGYSAICFACAAPRSSVVTIEERERSCYKARENIRRAGVSDRIRVIHGKAQEILPELTDSYDLIFIDAAKGQYMTFFELLVKNMRPGTVIVSDNVLYKGMPADDSFVTERRNKTIAKRMRSYLTFLTEHDCLETCLLSIGDGVAFSFCKDQPVIPAQKSESV